MALNSQTLDQNKPSRNKEQNNQQNQNLVLWEKIDKPLAKLTKGPRGSIQTNKIRNEKRDITTEWSKFKESSDSTTEVHIE